jgi:hypothetical protein
MERAKHLFQKVAQQRKTDTRERDAEKAALLLQRTFPAQRGFIEDPSDRKAALCPRQCGKSFAVLVYALYVGLRRPGANVVVLARVRRQVKGTYWADLQQFCRDFELGARFNKQELTCTLPNGSVILLSGADTAEEIDKHRGQRYDLIIIDEGKSYSAELMSEMIREVLEPALLAKRGTLAIIGTPGAILAGPFWEITTCQKNGEGQFLSRPWARRADDDWRGVRAPWSLHRWTQQDNTFCPWIWEGSLRIKEAHGYADDDPAWLREYLGVWVPDENLLVYAYSKALTGPHSESLTFRPDPETTWGLPPGHEWRFVLGMDLGYHDDTSFVVGAWSDTYPALIYIHAEKHPYLKIEDIAERCKELEVMFGSFDARVADTGGLGRTIVESLSATYGVAFEAARKSDKADHIKLLNSDILSGRVQVPAGSVLVEEWRTAQWEDAMKRRVDPNCDDHASDGALYIWRYCHHHWSRSPEVGESPGSPAWWRTRQREEELRYEQELLAGQRNPYQSRYSHLVKQDNPLRLAWTLRKLKHSLS